MEFANVNFVDGYAKVYKVRESGCSGLNINGQTIRQWCVVQAGPYQRRCSNPNPWTCYDEIEGVAMQDQYGWCARFLRQISSLQKHSRPMCPIIFGKWYSSL